MTEKIVFKAFKPIVTDTTSGMPATQKAEEKATTNPIDTKIGHVDKQSEELVSISENKNSVDDTLKKETGINTDEIVEAIAKEQNLTEQEKLSLKTSLTEKFSDKKVLAEFILEQKKMTAKNLKNALAEVQSRQGGIGKAWNWTKNLFGMKTGSDKVQETITKLEKGEISVQEAQKFFTNYYEGQQQVVDVVADLGSALAAGLMYSAALGGAVAAPFTGGASLGVTATAIAGATAAGAGVKAAIKGADAAVGGREYTLKDCGKDALTGGINGPLAFLTAGAGLVAAKGLAKCGITAAKTAVATTENQIVVGFGKATTRNAIVMAGKAAVQGTEVTINSAASNSAYRKAGSILFKNVSKANTEMLTNVAANATANNAGTVLLQGLKPTFGSNFLHKTVTGSAIGATYGAGMAAGNYTVESTVNVNEQFDPEKLATITAIGAGSGLVFGGATSAVGVTISQGLQNLPKLPHSAKSTVHVKALVMSDITPKSENLPLPKTQLPVTTEMAKSASVLPTVLAKANIKANDIATAVVPTLNNCGTPAISSATVQNGIATASVVSAIQTQNTINSNMNIPETLIVQDINGTETTYYLTEKPESAKNGCTPSITDIDLTQNVTKDGCILFYRGVRNCDAQYLKNYGHLSNAASNGTNIEDLMKQQGFSTIKDACAYYSNLTQGNDPILHTTYSLDVAERFSGKYTDEFGAVITYKIPVEYFQNNAVGGHVGECEVDFAGQIPNEFIYDIKQHGEQNTTIPAEINIDIADIQQKAELATETNNNEKVLNEINGNDKNSSILSESRSDLAEGIKFGRQKLEVLKREAEYEQLPKTPIRIGNTFCDIADLSEDPKFRNVVSKITNVKSTGQERVQEITDLLLEYMGYPKGIITPQICKKDGITAGSYHPDKLALEVDTETANSSNAELGSTIFHELTHMDNHMKVVKTLGVEQYLDNNILIKNMVTETLKNPQYKEGIISYLKENISDFPSQVTDEQLYSITYNEYLKDQSEQLNEFIKYTKMTDTEIISAIKDEYLNHSYKNSHNPTLLAYATDKYQYRHSPDEALAYARAEQFAYVAGIESEAGEHWENQIITEKAKWLAEDKAKQLFGHGNLEKLTEEQMKILDAALKKDVKEFYQIREVLEEFYQKGVDMPFDYKNYKSIFKNSLGCGVVEQYILYKIKDGPHGLITSKLRML